MHPLERQTLDLIRGNRLLEVDASGVVIGVSGGPDSVALLQVLATLQYDLGIGLTAVYVDHGLRPTAAESEASYVRSLASGLGVKCEVVSVAARERASSEKVSLEHAARDLRYEALRAVAAKCGAEVIAVAHTADDQAEEILIRLLRGGGRMAVSGMRARRGDLIRPFLHVEKDRILGYLKEKGLSYCIDATNEDMRFLRNRVRHRLLPYLEEHFERGVRRSLRKTADCLAEDEALLSQLTDEALEEVIDLPDSLPEQPLPMIRLNRSLLAGKPAALQRRIVEKVLWRVGGRATYEHIRKVVDAARSGRTGSELHLSGGLRLGVQREYLELLFPAGKGPWRGRLYHKDHGDHNETE